MESLYLNTCATSVWGSQISENYMCIWCLLGLATLLNPLYAKGRKKRKKHKRKKENESENSANHQCHKEMTLSIFLNSNLPTRFILHTGWTWVIFAATAGFAPLSVTNIPTGTWTTLEAFHSVVAPHACNTWISDAAGRRDLRFEVPAAVNI